ncbi:thymidine phosphorylase [Gemella haemolysans]|nr:thymidine phosphorylase [Gemella haemolysans]KAA8708908.1 thymidine phosphorylase [Gemella haemolysans]UBH82848.1 thymidine phosphorylase [Gemella haemolysans]VEI38887.1 Pyrimidine-nucleoside phosphorylase [Gemella haemolysans]
MRVVDIIDKKKKNKELTKSEIEFLLEGYLKGSVPDYQMSSFLMSVYFNNMTKDELTNFTLTMKDSGDTIYFDNLDHYLVDKHSTGGVGDKVTVVLGPILSAVGMATTKLSGKGLGHTGGTIDKFESIRNFKFSTTKEELVEVASKTGVGLMGYSDNIVPLDKKIYALRDVTATVDSIPLIASSIMSKKLAIQSDLIILDVKVGDGAFMKTIEDARELSRRMVEIGNSVGRKTIAVLTNMEEPLGYNIGNANEIVEGIEALKGNWSDDLKEVVYEIVYLALKHKGEVKTYEEAAKKIDEVIANGRALELLRQFIELSGGDGEVVNNYELLPTPKSVLEVFSEEEGFVTKIKAEEIGKAAMVIGAGRATKEDEVDHAVGIELKKKVGDKVEKGEIIAEIYFNDEKNVQSSKAMVIDAYVIGQEKIENIKNILEVIE